MLRETNEWHLTSCSQAVDRPLKSALTHRTIPLPADDTLASSRPIIIAFNRLMQRQVNPQIQRQRLQGWTWPMSACSRDRCLMAFATHGGRLNPTVNSIHRVARMSKRHPRSERFRLKSLYDRQRGKVPYPLVESLPSVPCTSAVSPLVAVRHPHGVSDSSHRADLMSAPCMRAHSQTCAQFGTTPILRFHSANLDNGLAISSDKASGTQLLTDRIICQASAECSDEVRGASEDGLLARLPLSSRYLQRIQASGRDFLDPSACRVYPPHTRTRVHEAR